MDTPKMEIKAYDFRSPKKFAKEQLKTIESLHENLARNLSSMITGLTRSFCEIQITQVEKKRYSEYTNSLSDFALFTSFDLIPIDESIEVTLLLMTIHPEIAYFLIDKLMGGDGSGYNLIREFTEIEMLLFEKFLNKVGRQIEISWAKYLEIEAAIKTTEMNPRIIQMLAPEDIVVVIDYKVTFEVFESPMKICLPAQALEMMMDRFTPKFAKSSNKKADDNRDEMQRTAVLNALKVAEVELKVVLDEIQLDLNDVLQLEINDLIPLTKRYDEPVTVKLDDHPWYTAKLGETKFQKAVRIESLIDTEDV